MMSYGNKRHCLATTASKPCLALYVIHLVVQSIFSVFGIDVLSRMRSSLLCVHVLHILCHILEIFRKTINV